jgi:hypothetical protein
MQRVLLVDSVAVEDLCLGQSFSLPISNPYNDPIPQVFVFAFYISSTLYIHCGQECINKRKLSFESQRMWLITPYIHTGGSIHKAATSMNISRTMRGREGTKIIERLDQRHL